ncbi:Alpha/Beta hydrolase protein [Aspergillus pseudoustus]|uniref:Alpha/Beta hydrolase protein n=1 Tax=Aspergillus pseudoustus TaxID=1810923 RepID=A0ABR4JF57_9EURO
MVLTKTINGTEISYDTSGYATGAPLVLLTGWAHDIQLYDLLLPHLAHKYNVVRINWRGHGPSRDSIADFGVEEQVSDTIALLDALDVTTFHLVSHSHGGWAGLGLIDKLGPSRVLSLFMIDQIMTDPPAPFASGLAAMQDKDSWKVARQGLFDNWLGGSDNPAVRDHFAYSFGKFGYDMWALSCRVIAGAYGEHGNPMKRMEKIAEQGRIVPIRHVFSHPVNDAKYRAWHEAFQTERRKKWFSWRDLGGPTHFPTLDSPEIVAGEIEAFMERVGTEQ